MVLVAATAATAIVGASAAYAESRPTFDCTLRFQLSGWSAIYERVDGTGIVACADGTALPVLIRAQGTKLTAARLIVTHGTGKFSGVHHITDVMGTYAQGDSFAGVAMSNEEPSLSNGAVSLALAGVGQGVDLGVGITGLTIRPQ